MPRATTDFSASATAVTPSDTTPVAFCGFYVGVSGDVTVITENNETILFKSVPTTLIIPIRVSRIKATGTTATNIVGFNLTP